jgi:hypothetical protein
MDHNGYPMTGRDPQIFADLIDRYGDDIWMGGEPLGGRGERHDPDHRHLHSRRPQEEPKP